MIGNLVENPLDCFPPTSLIMNTAAAPAPVIGTPGTPWGPEEKQIWLRRQTVQRSYRTEVLDKIQQLGGDCFTLEQYGALSLDPATYPLYSLRTKNWDSTKSSVLVTGGVHGYETSGVQGAIRFAEQCATSGADMGFNFVIAPCVSPWGYETINRWNHQTIDPNRSFQEEGGIIDESAMLLQHLDSLKVDFIAHFDLHETTDTDKTTFRPNLNARDGNLNPEKFEIPDGFYLVADPSRPNFEFCKAIIDGVKKVTHIVPPAMDCFHGVDIQQPGVIVVPKPAQSLGLCMGMTRAQYATTTEVYPDSPSVTAENCILAQVAAVVTGLEFISSRAAVA